MVISEKDRYLHTLVDGTSGTGKTSSTLLPAIKNDLDARCKAEALQLKDLHPFVENGKFIYNSKDNFFSINKFSPADDLNTSEKAKLSEKLEDLRLKHQVCGITVLAQMTLCAMMSPASVMQGKFHTIGLTEQGTQMAILNQIGLV